jgi:serine/threonine protein kinase
MEKCNCTVLEAFLKEEDTGEDDLCNCFRGMLKGLQHLHSREIVHRDVKPDNFLLEAGTKFSKDSVVKLCDFGLAAAIPKGQADTGGGCMLGKSSSLTNICGTAPYMAPEMLTTKNGGYGTLVDLWAMGVSAYLMLFGEFPYRPERTGSKEMMATIREGFQKPSYKARSGFPQPSKLACDFVAELLNRSAANRPDAETAQQNMFIKKVTRPSQVKIVENEPGTPPLPGSIRSEKRKQSFHHTLKVAQDVANQQYQVHLGRGGDVVRFPSPAVKNSFEAALLEMQKEHGGAAWRNSKRTMSGPSKSLSQVTFSDIADEGEASFTKQDSTGRSKARCSTHSGSFYMVPGDKNEESEGSDGGATRASSTPDPDDDTGRDVAQLKEPDVWKCASESGTPRKAKA